MIQRIVRKRTLNDAVLRNDDLVYWLSKSPEERGAAVDYLRSNAMEVEQDFRDLLALFNAHGVEYMIVGAYALGFHGAPRYTGDLDILVKPGDGVRDCVLTSLFMCNPITISTYRLRIS